MSLTYDQYVSQISNLLVIPSTDANFQTMLPGMIDYAEQRLYRELDLLVTQVTDASASVTTGNRNFALPTTTGTYIIVDNINVITPATATSSYGTRVQLVPTSREFLDIVYPGGTNRAQPQFYALASNTELIISPTPDSSYSMEVIGIQRPTPLSSANSSSPLTQYVPDLFVAASMIFGSGYQRDFSAQGDNPAQGNSWETQYQKLMASAQVEQARAHMRSQGWGTTQPSPLVQQS